MKESRLAASVGGNQADTVAHVKLKIKMVKHKLAAGIAEIDIL